LPAGEFNVKLRLTDPLAFTVPEERDSDSLCANMALLNSRSRSTRRTLCRFEISNGIGLAWI
jgi:hypothetical protein